MQSQSKLRGPSLKYLRQTAERLSKTMNDAVENITGFRLALTKELDKKLLDVLDL